MSLAMAYQYPLPSLGAGGDVPVAHLGGYQPLNLPSQPAPAQSSSPHAWNPDAMDKPKATRSMSTPNAHPNAVSDAAGMAMSAEKRRNKLGYHRTSVACGHCRRRKIRCIPAAGDLQRRCTNCIRLKKECNFFPVDQQPPPPGTKASKDKDAAASQTSSVPSSPSVQQPSSSRQSPYQPTAGAGIGERGDHDTPTGSDSFSPDSKGTFSRPFEYSNSTSPAWIPSDPSGPKPSGDMPAPSWSMATHESQMTAFAPYSSSMNPQQQQHAWPVGHADTNVREDHGWAMPPQRSLSYGNAESLASHAQFTPFGHPSSQMASRPEFAPRTPSHNASMYGNSSIPVPEGNTLPSDLPRGAVQSHLAGGFPTSQTWSGSLPYQKAHAPVTGDTYGGWYGVAGLPNPGHEDGSSASGAPYGNDSGNRIYYPAYSQAGR